MGRAEFTAMNVLVVLAGVGLLGLAFLGGSRKKTSSLLPPDPPAPPAPPTPPAPAGWRIISSVTPEMQAQAFAVLHSSAPMGSMNPFTASDGRPYGVFVTVHPGTVRATEIWEPA